MVDRHDVGRATDAGAGILSPETYGGSVPSFLDFADLAGEHYRTLVPALAELGAPDPRYDVCGTLRVGSEKATTTPFAANAEVASARHPGVLAHVTVDEARAMYPPLGPIRHALFNPRGARVDGRSMVAALEFAAAFARGGLANRDRAARRGRQRRDRRDADDHDQPGVVVIAGGAWTTELASAFGMRTGVRPVRGQIVHLHLDADTGSWPVLQPIFSHYVVPFRDGRLALGATVEDVGFEVRPTASGIAELLSEGLRLSPGLADATFLEVRVGLRPVSDDDLPVIGALPGAEDVYVASGHGANGLLLGPVTGRVVAEMVGGRSPAVDLSDFSPARFA